MLSDQSGSTPNPREAQMAVRAKLGLVARDLTVTSRMIGTRSQAVVGPQAEAWAHSIEDHAKSLLACATLMRESGR